ncbi:MAG: EamA family transporter, partial [Gammaproteobacteria bacterium]
MNVPGARTLALTALAMLAFAGNSLLCRVALRDTAIDWTSFTAIRLAAGALTLWLLVRATRGTQARDGGSGDWPSALALFVYAAAFSAAYLELSTGLGALLLFGAVQATMLGYGFARG